MSQQAHFAHQAHLYPSQQNAPSLTKALGAEMLMQFLRIFLAVKTLGMASSQEQVKAGAVVRATPSLRLRLEQRQGYGHKLNHGRGKRNMYRQGPDRYGPVIVGCADRVIGRGTDLSLRGRRG